MKQCIIITFSVLCLIVLVNCSEDKEPIIINSSDSQTTDIDSCGCRIVPDWVMESDIKIGMEFGTSILDGHLEFSRDEEVVTTVSQLVYDFEVAESIICRMTGGLTKDENGDSVCPVLIDPENKPCLEQVFSFVQSASENDNYDQLTSDILNEQSCEGRINYNPTSTAVIGEGRTVQVYNENGEPVVSITVDGVILSDAVQLMDLNQDGYMELIFGVSGEGEDSGKTFAIKADGSTLWTYDANVPYPYNSRGEMGQRVAQVLSDPESGSIYVLSQERSYYQCRLVRLGLNGEILNSYWHPGRIDKFALLPDENNDQIKLLAFYGVNNDSRAIFGGDQSYGIWGFLPSVGFSGQAFPYYGSGISEANEVEYRLLLPSSERFNSFSVQNSDVTGSTEIHFFTKCGLIIIYDAQGVMLGMSASDSFNCPPDLNYTRNIAPENADNDSDGYSVSEGDCDDSNPTINPRAIEIAEDGIDQNCDGVVDETPLPALEPSSVTFSENIFTLFANDGSTVCSGTVSTTTSPYWPNNDYRIIDAQLGDVDGDDLREIVTIARHRTYYPGQVSVWNENCELQGRYWNPGYLYSLLLSDITFDEIPDIIVGATNNDYVGGNFNIPTIFALKGDNVDGEAPPDRGTFSPGTHLWYKIVDSSVNAGIRNLSLSENVIKGNTSSDWTGTGYCLDVYGNVTSCI